MFYCPYLHFLPVINQQEAAHLLHLRPEDLHLRLPFRHAALLRSPGGGIGRQRVLPLVYPAVGAFLAVQAQVDLTALAAHRCSESASAAVVTFAGVAEGNVTRPDPNPVVIPHALLPVELQFAAGTLQAAAFVAFIGRLV